MKLNKTFWKRVIEVAITLLTAIGGVLGINAMTN